MNIVTNAELAVAATGTSRGDHDDRRPGLGGRDSPRTGTGNSGDRLTRIFEPFCTTGHVGEGVGLGLALADGIVREFGSRIAATTRPDGGAVFTVELLTA